MASSCTGHSVNRHITLLRAVSGALLGRGVDFQAGGRGTCHQDGVNSFQQAAFAE
jgi:hypothetical protein